MFPELLHSLCRGGRSSWLVLGSASCGTRPRALLGHLLQHSQEHARELVVMNFPQKQDMVGEPVGLFFPGKRG